MTAAIDFPVLPRRQVVLTMGGVMLAIFLASLDQTVVGTAMPRIIADLGGFDRFTWVTTAYLVASTTSVPIAGRLSDMFGRKRFYIGGIIVFLVGSSLAGFSQTMNQLIMFRAIQGIGGGVMMAIAFVSVGDLFPPAERGKYQGFLAAVFGLSSVIGPTLGGFITDALSWHWIFFLNIPIGIPIVLLFVRYFPQIRPSPPEHRLDYAGMAALILAVVPLLLGLSWGGVQYEWASPQVIGALLLSAFMTVAFIVLELRSPEPIMPPEIYRNSVVSLSLLATFLTGFGMFGAIIFIPLYFQGVLGASATSSGSFLTPMMLGVVVGAGLSGQALSRLGGHYRTQGLIGIVLMSVGMGLVSTMGTETEYAQAVAYIVVMGFGLGVTFPSFTIAVQNAVPHRVMGVATSAIQFYRSIGGTLGLAIMGSLMASRFSSSVFGSLSDRISQAIPRDQINDLVNRPQALMDEKALAGLRAGFERFGPQGVDMADELVETLQTSLSSAINYVFIIAVAIVSASFVVMLFVREIPLRQRQQTDEERTATESALPPASEA
jgi:EmrB/QacA subfamily drug resistance transporter